MKKKLTWRPPQDHRDKCQSKVEYFIRAKNRLVEAWWFMLAKILKIVQISVQTNEMYNDDDWIQFCNKKRKDIHRWLKKKIRHIAVADIFAMYVMISCFMHLSIISRGKITVISRPFSNLFFRMPSLPIYFRFEKAQRFSWLFVLRFERIRNASPICNVLRLKYPNLFL
jgi:hypothetical protein